MRVLFCGGGTAGHVYPNLAIAETLLRNYPNIKLGYVTTENGIENTLVDFEKFTIKAVGLNKRKPLSSGFNFTKTMILSINESKKIIKRFQPDVIFGTGGYATFPVVYAGHKQGIKTVLHESNAVPGKAIKTLEKKADLILVNYEETISYFSKKAKVKRVGNPVRGKFYSLEQSKAKKEKNLSSKQVVLSFGGSLGSPRINDSMIEFIENYLRFEKRVFLFFITGKKDHLRVVSILKEKGLYNLSNISVSDYAYDMPTLVSCADVVVSRAGAMTISELSLSGKCSVLVPSPNVANNHQYKNAKIIAEKDGAILITEDNLYKLTDLIKNLLADETKRTELERSIKRFSVPDANKTICNEIAGLIK